MKIFSIIYLCLGLTLSAVLLSCGAEEKTGKEYTSAYICPMHCEGSGGDQPDRCPACKMAYEKNENFKGEVKGTSNGHEGHDHGNHDGHNHSHEGHNH